MYSILMRNKAVFRILIVILLSLVVLCSSERSGAAASDIQSKLQDLEKKIITWIAAGNDPASIEPSIDKILLVVGSPKGLRIQENITKNITKTSGVYTCTTCSKAHKWYIDENHILYWEDKPYIPHALMGVEFLFDTDITNDRLKIDRRIKDGITEFAVQYRSDFEWSAIEEGLDISDDIRARDTWFDQITDHIISRGGTYILYNEPPFLPEGAHYDLNYLKQDAVKMAARDDLKRLKPLVAKKGLRAYVFFTEINSGGVIPPTDDTNIEEFKEVLNYYAKMVKDEIGNVPLVLRMADHFMYLPYLSAMSGDHIDGVLTEYNGFTPDDIRQMMSGSPYIRYFNSFNKTKAMWINTQASTGGNIFPPFVSYDVMWDQHKATVENGATGSVLDIYDYNWAGHNETAMMDTYRWYGQFKGLFQNLVLEKAVAKEFVTGKYASTDDLGFRYKTAVLTPEQVVSIIQNDNYVTNLLKTYPCLSINTPHFIEEGPADWTVVITFDGLPEGEELEVNVFQVDDKTGSITRNTISLDQQAKALGYIRTFEGTLKEYINEYGCK